MRLVLDDVETVSLRAWLAHIRMYFGPDRYDEKIAAELYHTWIAPRIPILGDDPRAKDINDRQEAIALLGFEYLGRYATMTPWGAQDKP